MRSRPFTRSLPRFLSTVILASLVPISPDRHLCLAEGAPARLPVLAGPMLNPVNGHLYYLLAQASWSDAEAEAIRLGGHLASVNDAGECQWIYENFSNWNGQPRSLWIGLTDLQTPGTYAWVNGDPLTFRNWLPGEPNRLNEFGVEERFAFIFPVADSGTPRWENGPDTITTPGWNASGSPGKWGDASSELPANGLVEVAESDIVLVQVTPGGRDTPLELAWNARAGWKYQAQWTADLQAPQWMNLGEAQVSLGGGVLMRHDPDTPPTQRFYRVAIIGRP